MPRSPKRPCAYHGCKELVTSGYCEKHKALAFQTNDRHKDWQRLYDTKRWKTIRIRQLAKEPWCAECLRANIYTPATDVDHIDPHRGDPILFFKGPFQSLCKPCHSRKTMQEIKGRGGKNV